MGTNGGDHQRGVGAMAEIDTSAPFASVKEAIMLFGEKVLVGEIYANRLNQVFFYSLLSYFDLFFIVCLIINACVYA